MKQLVWDIETNGLLDELDRIHVIAWQEVGSSEVYHTGDYDKMRGVILSADVSRDSHLSDYTR